MPDKPVALVTGASQGLGHHIAGHLSDSEYEVVGCSRSMPEHPFEAVDYLTGDVTDEASVRSVIRTIGERYGRLDVVICNAGVASMNPLLLSPRSSASTMFETNLIGTMLVAREATRLLRRSDRGRIVTMSSVAVPLMLEGESLYSASKAAVEQLTKVMAREFSTFGITCNCVGPGPIDTDLIAGVSEEKISALTDRLVGGKKSTFSDVTNVIDFFLSESSRAITGQIVYLGGV